MKKINIGFFDSGVGGVAYLNGLRKALGNQVNNYNFFYLSDNEGFPYGLKEKDFLIERVLLLAQKFIRKELLDILVIACNTASLLTVELLREELHKYGISTLIVGVVPAIKPAVESKSERIYVMNTQLSSYTEYAKEMASQTKIKYGFESKIFLRGCQELVEAIELMFTHREDSYEAYMIAELDHIIDEIISLECQAIVLGCTHFLHIKKHLEEILENKTTDKIIIIDSLEGVVNRTLRLLEDFNKDISDVNVHSENKPSFFYTKEDENKYKIMCQYFDLEFNGLL